MMVLSPATLPTPAWRLGRIGSHCAFKPIRKQTDRRHSRCIAFFSRGKPNVGLRSTRDELLTALLKANSQTSVAQISNLVDQLASTPSKFDQRLLGGGPWVVVFTKGAPQLWKLTYEPSKVLNPNNQASQDFDPVNRKLINKAEYFGGNVYVTASGTFEAVDDAQTTPKEIEARIEEGRLVLWGFEVPLPIRGTGRVEVCYLDDTLRVFRSGSSYSVQVRADRLGEWS